MKNIVIGLLILVSGTAFATANTSSADWVVEASVMIVKGTAAGDLYNSLNADDTLDPHSTKWDEYRIKENAFAKCGVSFYRYDSADGEPTWIMQNNAECMIKAPTGTTVNQ